MKCTGKFVKRFLVSIGCSLLIIGSVMSVHASELQQVIPEGTYETFNEIDYATRYPDVMNVFGLDKAALWNHYQNNGKLEGRIALFNTANVTPQELSVTEKITRQANAEYKFERFKQAYFELVDSGDWLAYNCHDNTENLWYSLAGEGMTADGKGFKDNYTVYAMTCFYYNQYVNADGYLYDFTTWMLNQPSSDYIKETYIPGMVENVDTNDCLMFEGIGVISYITSFNESKIGEIYDTEEYSISGIKSAYAAKVILDGKEDSRLTVVFDKDGNMLNICATEDFNDYITTFAH